VTGDGCRPAAKRAPPRTSLMQPPFSQTLGAGGHVTYPSQRHSSLEYSQRPCNKPARREPGWRCCRHAARSPRHLISHNQDTNHYNFTREQNQQSTIDNRDSSRSNLATPIYPIFVVCTSQLISRSSLAVHPPDPRCGACIPPRLSPGPGLLEVVVVV
jgi:hypothetical protein